MCSFFHSRSLAGVTDQTAEATNLNVVMMLHIKVPLPSNSLHCKLPSYLLCQALVFGVALIFEAKKIYFTVNYLS